MEIKKQLAREAYSVAITARKQAKSGLSSAICIFDLVTEAGLEVRFQNISSMEGLYYNDGKPLIILSSCRPRGRVAYNCAHEYGHHIFGHGDRIDEVLGSNKTERFEPEEFLADCFAGFFLMPKIAISKAFSVRGWNVKNCTPEQVFIVSGYMGVGYNSLLTHMYYSLNIISSSLFNRLKKISPKTIKRNIANQDAMEEVVVFDGHWDSKPIDVCVGDLIILPPKTTSEGVYISRIGDCAYGEVYMAIKQGIDKVQGETEGWASYVRITRKHFVGLSQHRHFPEAGND